MKSFITYTLLVLFTFAFAYKTVKCLSKVKVTETCCSNDMNCENEKEDSVEKNEMKDMIHHSLFQSNLLIIEERQKTVELIINFVSANYKNSVFSPPEVCC